MGVMKEKAAVLKGGPSLEREVSLRSGAAVAGGLREAGYDVAEIDVRGRDLDIPGDVDVVFIALHGDFGEDGEVQELLEAMGIPYTGSGPEASRAAFDKILCKKMFAQGRVPSARYEIVSAGGARRIPLPVVVKPPRQGSSIGVNMVFSEDSWNGALADALKYDKEALVEEYIEGRELTVGILEGEPLPVIEIKAGEGWYDYNSKYLSGSTCYEVPARLTARENGLCSDAAVRAWQVLGCEGFARVDLRMDSTGNVYVLEVNTIPGFTETSLLPKSAAEAGISFSGLCERILVSAERFSNRGRTHVS